MFHIYTLLYILLSENLPSCSISLSENQHTSRLATDATAMEIIETFGLGITIHMDNA